ncbi:MAG TPA: nitrate reductase molybdenum cofactor assembly chaperone [Candidatus Azoamicus sp.]
MYPNVQLKNNIDYILLTLNKDEEIFKKNELLSFLKYFKESNLTSLQEHYVSIFDRQKKFSLYLFEHIHGDSRERGTAIIDLQNLYKSHNFFINESKE